MLRLLARPWWEDKIHEPLQIVPVRIPVLDITRQAWSLIVVVMAVRVLIYAI
jgi:hypothetical protein